MSGMLSMDPAMGMSGMPPMHHHHHHMPPMGMSGMSGSGDPAAVFTTTTTSYMVSAGMAGVGMPDPNMGMSGDPAMNNGPAANSGDPAGSGCSPGAVYASAMNIPDGGCCNSGAQC